MKPVLITHLGLGDAIVCAGLAVELSNRHNGLIFPCWKHNEVSVKSFFVNYPEILIWPIEAERDLSFLIADKECILTGHYSGIPTLREEGFDSWIYRTAGVDIRHRWESDPIPQAAHAVKQLGASHEGSFLHQDLTRGFKIKDDYPLPIPTALPWSSLDGPTKMHSILTYAQCLSIVPAIHVINSSFFHLSESLPTTGSLHLHQYARPHARIDMPCLRKKWEIIE